MIIAAGLTPAWQQIMRFDDFRAGEVNRAREVHWCASGKVLNVAIALAHLGAECTTIAPVGGPAGQQIDCEFTSLGIRRQWIESQTATRVCTTILTRLSGTTELVENAGPLTPDEIDRFRAAFNEQAARAKLIVLSGSLTAVVPATLFRDLLTATTLPAILDIRGPELLAALECRPLLVKPNREELALMLRRAT